MGGALGRSFDDVLDDFESWRDIVWRNEGAVARAEEEEDGTWRG